MMATPTSRPRMPAACRSLRIHVDRHRIAFAVVRGVGDLDVVDVDVVVAEAARSSSATKRMAVLRPRIGGDVVALADESRCRWRRRQMRPTSVQVVPPLPLACTETYSPASRPLRSVLELERDVGRARRRRGAAVDRAVAAAGSGGCRRDRASRWSTLPSYGELLSFCSTQSPYQRCVPSLLANEPVSKLSRTLAAASVVTGRWG